IYIPKNRARILETIFRMVGLKFPFQRYQVIRTVKKGVRQRTHKKLSALVIQIPVIINAVNRKRQVIITLPVLDKARLFFFSVIVEILSIKKDA
ncbi:MAG: hypothetical protein LBH96_03260, partial [Candidatus Peribacteria bacterium]|nr:hypothetical protein [Candidatus Peribacteria bacterium]